MRLQQANRIRVTADPYRPFLAEQFPRSRRMTGIEWCAIGGLNANRVVCLVFGVTAVTRRQLGTGVWSGAMIHNASTGLL